jgi:hypothetical protein
MNELYFTKTNREIIQVVRLEYGQLGEKYVLKTFEGEENPNGLFLHKSIFPREEVFDNGQVMLKEVWELRKRLSEDRWTLETKEESPTTHQTSFITLKTIDGDLSMEYDN